MAIWHDVCTLADLKPNAGVCALIEGRQVALFYLLSVNPDNSAAGQCFALSNFDPIGQANVLSRGICGDIDGQPVVASPLYKQHFNLKTGVCLEEPELVIPVYAVRSNRDRIEVCLSSAVTVDRAVECCS